MSFNPEEARQNAIRTAKQWVAKAPIYLDTETTGFKPWDQIVEISIIDTDGTELLNSLVKPSKPIPVDAMKIHGISDLMVANAPSWAELWPQVSTLMAGRVLGIYNEEFDVRLMKQSSEIHKLPWSPPYKEVFCIMNLYAEYHGEWNPRFGNFRWQSLEKAGQQLGIVLPNTHRALADTLLSKAVLENMAAG